MIGFDFLQVHDDRPYTEWEQQCHEQLHRVINPVYDTYRLITIPHFDTLTETANYSDAVRGEWLAAHPDGVYVDTDCWLDYRFTPEARGIVHLPRNANLSDGEGPDIFLIYVNGDTEWIKRNFSQRVRDRWLDKYCDADKRESFYGFPLQVTRAWTGFKYLPDNLYKHNYQTMRAEIARRRVEMSTKERHVNDVTSEQLDTFDAAVAQMKTFARSLRDIINQQANRITELEKENAKIIEQAKAVATTAEAAAAAAVAVATDNTIPLNKGEN